MKIREITIHFREITACFREINLFGGVVSQSSTLEHPSKTPLSEPTHDQLTSFGTKMYIF